MDRARLVRILGEAAAADAISRAGWVKGDGVDEPATDDTAGSKLQDKGREVAKAVVLMSDALNVPDEMIVLAAAFLARSETTTQRGAKPGALSDEEVVAVLNELQNDARKRRAVEPLGLKEAANALKAAGDSRSHGTLENVVRTLAKQTRPPVPLKGAHRIRRAPTG